jgi:hypothetical protein
MSDGEMSNVIDKSEADIDAAIAAILEKIDKFKKIAKSKLMIMKMIKFGT